MLSPILSLYLLFHSESLDAHVLFISMPISDLNYNLEQKSLFSLATPCVMTPSLTVTSLVSMLPSLGPVPYILDPLLSGRICEKIGNPQIYMTHPHQIPSPILLPVTGGNLSLDGDTEEQ